MCMEWIDLVVLTVRYLEGTSRNMLPTYKLAFCKLYRAKGDFLKPIASWPFLKGECKHTFNDPKFEV